jgi:hypothetical protein
VASPGLPAAFVLGVLYDLSIVGVVIATMGLASLTAVALLPALALITISAFVMRIGIGTYHL